ncbi:hypothetical protein [Bdellovibrio sp. HCB337]|uniref:hypothetical protein n=1 Tax=Bdellovibrio sp. HCB337 TaxID=3394358 RepID=UPI0039A40287
MESDSTKAPREKQIRWAAIIVTFFFIGLAIDYFFLHILFKEKMREQQKQEQQQQTEPSSRLNDAEKAKQAAKNPPKGTPLTQFQNIIEKCLGDKDLAKSTSTDVLIKELESKNPVKETQFQLENTHIRLSDGTTRRLHLIQSDSSNKKNAKELRYFKLDEEGLPVSIPLENKDRINPKPEFIAELKKQGTQIFHQVKENKLLKDGTILALNTVNDRVFEFQHFGKGNTLSCRELDCRCQ